MVRKYMVTSYAVLVKAGAWDLEQIEGSEKPVVPDEYRMAVAEYLVGI